MMFGHRFTLFHFLVIVVVSSLESNALPVFWDISKWNTFAKSSGAVRASTATEPYPSNLGAGLSTNINYESSDSSGSSPRTSLSSSLDSSTQSSSSNFKVFKGGKLVEGYSKVSDSPLKLGENEVLLSKTEKDGIKHYIGIEKGQENEKQVHLVDQVKLLEDGKYKHEKFYRHFTVNGKPTNFEFVQDRNSPKIREHTVFSRKDASNIRYLGKLDENGNVNLVSIVTDTKNKYLIDSDPKLKESLINNQYFHKEGKITPRHDLIQSVFKRGKVVDDEFSIVEQKKLDNGQHQVILSTKTKNGQVQYYKAQVNSQGEAHILGKYYNNNGIYENPKLYVTKNGRQTKQKFKQVEFNLDDSLKKQNFKLYRSGSKFYLGKEGENGVVDISSRVKFNKDFTEYKIEGKNILDNKDITEFPPSEQVQEAPPAVNQESVTTVTSEFAYPAPNKPLPNPPQKPVPPPRTSSLGQLNIVESQKLPPVPPPVPSQSNDQIIPPVPPQNPDQRKPPPVPPRNFDSQKLQRKPPLGQLKSDPS